MPRTATGTVRRQARIIRRTLWTWAAQLVPPAVTVTPLPLKIRAGRYFTDKKARRLPIVILVATGLREEDAEALAREIERAQLMTASFRPVFVIDSADFTPFRRRGYVVERVMPADEFRSIAPTHAYLEYLTTRLETVLREYRAISIIPIVQRAAETDSAPSPFSIDALVSGPNIHVNGVKVDTQ